MTENQFEDQKLIEDVAMIRRTLTRLICAFALLIVVLAAMAFWPHARPYVAVVDRKTGEVITVANAVSGVESLNDATIEFALKDFIKNAQTVTADYDEEKERMLDTFAVATGQAAKALHDRYHDGEHDPFELGKKGWVDVENVRTLKLPDPGNYELAWTEVAHKLSQEPPDATQWHASVKVETRPTADRERNPMGLFVTVLNSTPDTTAREGR
jgi:type IV secretory pathway TrbF-like protein